MNITLMNQIVERYIRRIAHNRLLFNVIDIIVLYW